MKLPVKQCNLLTATVLMVAVSSMISSANAANVTIDYVKQGTCNSSILVRVGDYCDYMVTITIPSSGSNASTDLSVEIIMPDNGTSVMQVSKPEIMYVGSNFINTQNIYDPTITMTSSTNTSQYSDARIDFGTVVNSGLSAPSNSTQSTIQIRFRSVVINSPGSLSSGSQYWVTVGIEYNNVSEIWIGQALFIISNSSSGGVGSFSLGTVSNSTLQIPQGSPFALAVPVNYNGTYASNFVFTITNNNPTQIGLCSAYVQTATNGFAHLPTLGYEISTLMTTALTNNQITISLGQIVNAQSYSGSPSTLNVIVHGRVFKTDGISSFSAGSLTAQVTSGAPTVSQSYTIYATSSVAATALNGSLPTFSISQQATTVGIYQTLKMTVSMVVPAGFSAPVVIDLNGAANATLSPLKACSVVFQSAGENVGGSDPQCADTSLSRRTYTASDNSTTYDQMTYDYGVIQNVGPRSTYYADNVNTVTFDAVFQAMNTTQTLVWPTVAMTLGNNTIWLGNAAVNVTSMDYNSTAATQPTFELSYDSNSTSNQSATTLGYTRLFYYDIYTKASGVYTPMTVRITTNETLPGSSLPAASICLVKVLYVGKNLPCLVDTYYNQAQSPYITYSSRYNSRKNDTVYIQFGPLCNYKSTQTDSNDGRIRLGVYVKVEEALGDGQSTYVSLDVYYSPTNLWIGQILFMGSQLVTAPNVAGTPYFYALNASTPTVTRNALTVVNYGLKIPSGSRGTYTSLSSVLTEGTPETSVCRVDISPNRGSNVPCVNDVTSTFTYSANGVSTAASSNLGLICNIGTNTSSVNNTPSADSDTIFVQVYLLATTASSATFNLALSNLVPSGQAALPTINSAFTTGSAGTFGNASSVSALNTTTYQQPNDTSNSTIAYLGQDVSFRTQFVLGRNLSSQACYPLMFQFSIVYGSADAAYFTTASVISNGDNLMCVRSKSKPTLASGGSAIYNSSMLLDLNMLCYYPIDPANVSANTLVVQGSLRVPVSTSVPANSQFSVNIAALLNNNQTSVSANFPLTVKNYTGYSGFIQYSNDSNSVVTSQSNATVQNFIRIPVVYEFKVYLPTYSQGRLELLISSVSLANYVTINLVSANIISAGVNVQSFMAEYAVPNKYQWRYSSSVPGSTFQDTAYLDLGVVTNTGLSATQGNFSNLTDNFIVVQALGYLTDSPTADTNNSFTMRLLATFAGRNASQSYAHAVMRNGTEKPDMIVTYTQLTSGPYAPGSTFRAQVQFAHTNTSNADCVNAQLIVYLPTWVSLQSYNSSRSGTNYTTDNSSYVLFNFGEIFYNDGGSLTFNLNIGTSNQMALVYQRYNSPYITIPYEFMCMKRPRVNVAYYPVSKIFVFPDVIPLTTSMTPASVYPALLDSLATCQFTSSVPGSDATLVRSTGWSTGYRSNAWMLSGSTYAQISFGNLTLIKSIQLTVPPANAPIRTIQLGYSWDGDTFVMHPATYAVNGSLSYAVPLMDTVLLRYLRIYIIDVMVPTDMLTKVAGFYVNISGTVNSTGATTGSSCPAASSSLLTRMVLVAPAAQTGLTYASDVYVCDETTTRTSFACHVLHNGNMASTPTWTALNTTVGNINRFVFDVTEQIQSLYGYAQDGSTILRSDDRGLTWKVTDTVEYNNVVSQCGTSKVCSTSTAYPVAPGTLGRTAVTGTSTWSASAQGVWTQTSGGVLAFNWFDN